MNDDLIGIIISHLDITLYAKTTRLDLLTSLGANNHQNMLQLWWKNTNSKTEKTKHKKNHYVNGKLHCEDGPAVEYADGTK
jgi:hypothetical protein